MEEGIYISVGEVYLRDTGAGVRVARGMVTESWETGQDEMDGTDLQSHSAQQHTVISGQRSAAEQGSQDMKWQRGQYVSWRRLQDVT